MDRVETRVNEMKESQVAMLVHEVIHEGIPIRKTDAQKERHRPETKRRCALISATWCAL